MSFTLNRLSANLFLTVLLCQGVLSRPDYRPYYQGLDIPQYVSDEIESMDDDIYSEVRKYPEINPKVLAAWPWMNELLPGSDFDDELRSNLEDILEKYGLPESMPTPLPLKKSPPVKKLHKEQAKKKNVHSGRRMYMSPCHFKICNMGRKRNARYIQF